MDDVGTAGPGRKTPTMSVESAFESNPDGTVQTTLSVLQHGRTRVEAEVTLAPGGGWQLYPEDPSLTVHTRAGTVRVAAPDERALPKVALNPDGTVTVEFSLFNRAGVDISISVLLRHKDGWWLSPERPEVTVRPGKRPNRVSCRFRPPQQHRCAPGDEATLQVQMKGLPVADATVKLRKKAAIGRRLTAARLSALLLAVPVVLLGAGLAVLADRSVHDVSQATPVSVELPPRPGEQVGTTDGTSSSGGSTDEDPPGGGPDDDGSEQDPDPEPPVPVSTTTVITDPPVTQPPCSLSTLTAILRDLGPLPLIGDLGSLVDIDRVECLRVDLEACLSSVSGSLGTMGTPPAGVPPLGLSACVPLNLPAGS